jgi:SAM-dependent methyltransferase
MLRRGPPPASGDLAARPALFAQLSETSVMAPAAARAYLGNSLERFQLTVAMLPELPAGARVLELGANPYFLSRLLRGRGIEARPANWFGDSWPADACSQVVVESGLPHRYDFDHFNAERDPFPYDAGEFDLVLFCEVLEHLPHDPVHALREVHRVLRPGGFLLLTTPNAARWDNLLRALRGDNTHDTLSGFGVYGRHNREYTKDELVDLVTGCGFRVEQVDDRDVGTRQVFGRIPRRARRDDRCEQLLLLATAGPRSPWYYPSWLYDGRAGLYRCVARDVIVGDNCYVQAQGLHDIEEIDGAPGRWAGAEARLLLEGDGSMGRVTVRGVAPSPRVAHDLDIALSFTAGRCEWSVPCDAAPFERSRDVALPRGVFEAVLSVAPTWSPAAVFGTGDGRDLGFVLRAVTVETGQSASQHDARRAR